MNTKTTKTIVFAALIAAMILPFSGMQSAEATSHGENLTIKQLERLIYTSENRVIHFEEFLAGAESIYQHRTNSIIEHQAILDGLDEIVDNGDVLTSSQIVFYDDTVNEIDRLVQANIATAINIGIWQINLDHQLAVLEWALAELASRATVDVE